MVYALLYKSDIPSILTTDLQLNIIVIVLVHKLHECEDKRSHSCMSVSIPHM